MADVKWIKIVTDIFDDEKILLIEQLPEADSVIVIWFKLLCLAGKQNNSGVFMMANGIAYTDDMLAAIFRRKKATVQMALGVFEQFGMIEIINGAVTIPNWGKHQFTDKIEARNEYMKNYMRDYRAKQALLASNEDEDEDCKVNGKLNSKVNVKHPDNSKQDNKIKDEIIREDNPFDKVVEAWNSLSEFGIPEVKRISASSQRAKLLNARLREYGENAVVQAIDNIKGSDFLKGYNNKGWQITFDWFVAPNNFVKVYEGNYIDKQPKSKPNPNLYSHAYTPPPESSSQESFERMKKLLQHMRSQDE